MINFWIIGAVLVAGALMFLLPLLLRGRVGPVEARALTVAIQIYRDKLKELEADLAFGKLVPKTHAQSKRELERQLLEEIAALPAVSHRSVTPRGGKTMALLLGVAVPLVAVVSYLHVGSPSAIDPAKTAAAGAKVESAPSAHAVAQMVESLAAKLKKNPNDGAGWHMLARSYGATGQLRESAEAYAKAAALVPGDPQLLSDYAVVLAMTNGRNLNGKPTELVLAALKLDPDHQRSLALAATAALNQKDYTAAIGYWERLQKTFPAGSENARMVAARIAEARAAAEAKPLAAAPRSNSE